MSSSTISITEKVCIGIDLGTTYTSISIYNENRQFPEVISQQGGLTSFPSCVSFQKRKDNTIQCLSGRDAKLTPSKCFIYDSKRLLGKSYEDYNRIGNEKNHWTFDVEDAKDGLVKMVISHPSNQEEEAKFYPEEISGFILRNAMKTLKMRYPNIDIGQVVVTIPVDFKANQRQATIRACKLAGLENVQLINEPSSSIISYRKNYSDQFKEPKKVLVIDFGGGTLDICLCKVDEKNIEVVSNGGNQNLGGNNFDKIMMDLLLEKIKQELNDDKFYKKNFVIDKKDTASIKRRKRSKLNKLKLIAEETKIKLSSNMNHEIDMENHFGEEFENITINVFKLEFEDRCRKEKLIINFEKVLNEVLEKANISREDIDLILPIGGSCSMPIVKETIKTIFNDIPFGDPRFDSLEAVSKGAAICARDIFLTGKIVNFVDVLPYNIGIEMQNSTLDIIGKKNQKLPIKATKQYHPTERGKSTTKFKLFCGKADHTDASDMQKINKLIIHNIDTTIDPHQFVMDAHFEIDTSGIVTVEVYRHGFETQLGRMEVTLNVKQYDENIDDLLEHMKEYDS